MVTKKDKEPKEAKRAREENFEIKIIKKKFKIQLITELLGTIPKDPEVYKEYIESKKPESIKEDESLGIDIPEGEHPDKRATGFFKDQNGLYILDIMIRGFLKNAGNILKDQLKLKAVKSKIDNLVFVTERKIYLGKMEPDSSYERSIRVMTPTGPRVSFIRSDLIDAGLVLEFEIYIIENEEITMKTIENIFKYGQICGLGQFRNGSFGRFVVLEDEVEKEEVAA